MGQIETPDIGSLANFFRALPVVIYWKSFALTPDKAFELRDTERCIFSQIRRFVGFLDGLELCSVVTRYNRSPFIGPLGVSVMVPTFFAYAKPMSRNTR
jgi:hypothetical protein